MADLVVVEKLHAAGSLVEVVTERDDTFPVLYFSGFGPKGYVERFRGLEEFTSGGNVDRVWHDLEASPSPS